MKNLKVLLTLICYPLIFVWLIFWVIWVNWVGPFYGRVTGRKWSAK